MHQLKKKFIHPDNIKEGLQSIIPENYNIVKALLGDNSDNLKGVKGLGIKTIVSQFPKLVDKPSNGFRIRF